MISNRDAFSAKLTALIAASGKTNGEIATELGYRNANAIDLITNGSLRLPLTMVEPLARLLGLEPDQLAAEWLEAYCPDVSPSVARGLVRASAVPGRDVR